MAIRPPLRILLTLLAGALSLRAATSAYPNAITDRNLYPKPPLPQCGPGSAGFGPASTVFHDPTFGSRILRVTDPTITGDAVNAYSASAAYQNTWANDDQAFLVWASNGGVMLFQFDPVNFQATSLGYIRLSSAAFSFQYPHIIYGLADDGHTITSYDYTTGIYTPILDLMSVMPFTQYASGFSLSYDDDHFAIAFGGIQDTHPYVVYYQRSTGATHLLDLSRSTIDGVATNIPVSIGVHSLQLDMAARFVEVVVNGALGGVYEWDTQTNQLATVTTYTSGHIALGFGARINQSGFRTPDIASDSRGFTLRQLSDPNDNLLQLIAPLLNAPYSWTEDGHWSWNNSKPGQASPICGTFYSQPDLPAAWSLWFDEIDCVATDGSGTVWRFAHHRSVYNGDFWSAPRGNISQDGKFFLFTSNWEETLGDNGARLDVFLADLTSASSPGKRQPLPSTAFSIADGPRCPTDTGASPK